MLINTEVLSSVLSLTAPTGGIDVAPAGTSTICPARSLLRSLGFAARLTAIFPSSVITFALPLTFDISSAPPPVTAVTTAPDSIATAGALFVALNIIVPLSSDIFL